MLFLWDFINNIHYTCVDRIFSIQHERLLKRNQFSFYLGSIHCIRSSVWVNFIKSYICTVSPQKILMISISDWCTKKKKRKQSFCFAKVINKCKYFALRGRTHALKWNQTFKRSVIFTQEHFFFFFFLIQDFALERKALGLCFLKYSYRAQFESID